MVINKTGADINDAVTLANFSAAASAQAWRYSSANLGAIVRDSDAAVNGGSVALTFPANSITLLVVPAADTGSKPKVNAVVNAASYSARSLPARSSPFSGAASARLRSPPARSAPPGWSERTRAARGCCSTASPPRSFGLART